VNNLVEYLNRIDRVPAVSMKRANPSLVRPDTLR
jgi:hypothetical protein